MLAAADELVQGSLEAAQEYLESAARGEASVLPGRRGQARLLLAVVRLMLARQRGNLSAVAQEARRLQAAADPRTRASRLLALVHMGDMEAAGRVLAGLGDQNRDRGETRIAVAVLRLAQGDPRAALAELAPVRDGSAPLVRRSWLVIAFLLDAVARDALGDPVAAGTAPTYGTSWGYIPGQIGRGNAQVVP